MTANELLPEVKKWMYAISNAADDEYVQTINACVYDLFCSIVGNHFVTLYDNFARGGVDYVSYRKST